MDEINLIERKPPKAFEYYLQKTLILIGERLAIILFILSIPIILILFRTPQAFSEQKKEVFIKQSDTWYKTTSAATPLENVSNSYAYSLATVTPSPSPSPAPTSAPASSDIWDKLAQCESKGNWGINTGNGYYGGLQFSEGAWRSVGGVNMPHEASRDEQIMRGKMLQEKRGWGPWGGCSKKLGLL